ncbi:hydrogenase formation protein HypD [Candidatus Gracilibacteria bacterium]|nr:hydrogenase formation protein HypD [Candidatus Gracilibacteria bacterium]
MNHYLKKIDQLAKKIGDRRITIMEVCGGHTNIIMQYGIRDILPSNIRLVSGPGCPVCVTAQSDIDAMVVLAKAGIGVATYGDMLDVPGTRGSLNKAKEEGADIKMIFSAMEMLLPENKDRVFFGIGFETTTPMTAYLLSHGIMVYSVHKIMIPAMKVLVESSKIDGFIDPGHVSCITGSKMWEELKVPQVISGFGKDQIIRAIYKVLKLIYEGKNEVINDYEEVVKSEGNLKAQKLISQYLKSYEADWRGLGQVNSSGLEPKDENLNARVKYGTILKNIKSVQNSVCRCGEILKGECEPKDCPLFGKVCTPKNPVGACMVSSTEGGCGIAYKFLKK